MPLARYFLLVGGALFVLLLVAAALLPPLPVAERADTHRTEIRIHSEQKRPERVVFDTRMPALIHSDAPLMTEAVSPTPQSADDVSAKARQAFAQLQPSDVSKSKAAELRRPQLKPSPSRKRETWKRAAAPRKMRLARQQQLDWFGSRMWW